MVSLPRVYISKMFNTSVKSIVLNTILFDIRLDFTIGNLCLNKTSPSALLAFLKAKKNIIQRKAVSPQPAIRTKVHILLFADVDLKPNSTKLAINKCQNDDSPVIKIFYIQSKWYYLTNNVICVDKM